MSAVQLGITNAHREKGKPAKNLFNKKSKVQSVTREKEKTSLFDRMNKAREKGLFRDRRRPNG